MTIFRRYYHYVNDQNTITYIGEFLDLMSDIGFSLVSYERPESDNPRYPNLEIVLQRSEPLSEIEKKALKKYEEYPIDKSIYWKEYNALAPDAERASEPLQVNRNQFYEATYFCPNDMAEAAYNTIIKARATPPKPALSEDEAVEIMAKAMDMKPWILDEDELKRRATAAYRALIKAQATT